MSMLMNLAAAFLRLSQRKRRFQAPASMRSEYSSRTYPAAAKMPRSLTRLCDVQSRTLNRNTVLTLTPKQRGAAVPHVIYTHGGAYIHPLVGSHWSILEAIIRRTHATVTVPLYTLAPEATYREAYELLEAVYRDILALDPPRGVVLAGDSAGGGLALGQAILYRDRSLPAPRHVVLFSPWLDITMSNPAIVELEPEDPMLATPGLVEAGRWWAGGDDPKQPLLSPIFANLSGLPSLTIYQGTRDLFLADARRLAELVKSAGGSATLHEYPGAFHVFVGATWLPEAAQALDDAAKKITG
jgi:monoterpene epsilon-lactone hydrolase